MGRYPFNEATTQYIPSQDQHLRLLYPDLDQDAASKLWASCPSNLSTPSPSRTSARLDSSPAALTTTSHVTTTTAERIWKPLPTAGSSRSCQRFRRIRELHVRPYGADGIPGWTDSIEAWNRIRRANINRYVNFSALKHYFNV